MNPNCPAAAQSAEYDEIPLDSSSEASSDTSISDSGSNNEANTEAEIDSNILISTGGEHVPIQPHLLVPTAASVQIDHQDQSLLRKRKSRGEADTIPHEAVPAKKVKLDEKDTVSPMDVSLLPAEIWHRVFTFIPPQTLGNLLCVNKLFNVYLDPLSSYQYESPPSISQTPNPPLKPDTIWQLSRRRFWPRMPAPLTQKTELDMWQLVCGKTCQFCAKENLESPQQAHGQRREKIQRIWAFALRSCGPCLVERTVKEIDLLLSSSVPSVLISALPFVLTTSEMHTISPDALQRGLLPPDLQVNKIYLSEHVEKLKQEFLSVKSMGGATVEEWLKGLELRGKESLSDSMRWEKWASTGGITQLSQDNVWNTHISSEEDPTSQKSSLQHGTHSSVSRVRTREEALELKAARRVEIERRAMELDPPLKPDILALIPSFQAAIQIISPLDDNAWKLLKPRLLSQRVDAEKNAEEEPGHPGGTVQSHPAPARTEESPCEEGNNIATKQLIDKAWDDIQAPLRAQISAYADEVIRDDWSNGKKVNVETSPQFAAEVLLCVRKRFYAKIARAATAAREAGQQPVQDPPNGPFTQKLTLENMRWLFDVKIKPHTESCRKDLFFCNGCEVSFKAFGFEGVIQHYAAKHTDALSLGSVVVHWRAEWPEIPPFKPDPQNIKIAGPSEASRSQHETNSRHSHTTSLFTIPPLGYGHTEHGLFTPHSVPYTHQSGVYQGQSSSHSLHPVQYVPHYPYPPGLPQSYPPGVYSTPPAYSPVPNPYSGHNYNAYPTNSQPDYQTAYSNSLTSKYHTQLEHLARSSRELWTATAGLKELPGSIRVCVVIHHIVQRFRSRFSESPPLAMFIDGLSNNKEMRPVRNINGLICKACHFSLIATDQDRKTFSLPQLVNHFQQNHVDRMLSLGAPCLDWAVEMVHTPDLSVLSNLRHLTNMDNQKFSLVSDAFPYAQYTASFAQGVSTSSSQDAWANNGIASNVRQHSACNSSIQGFSHYDTSSPQPLATHSIKAPGMRDTRQSPTMGQKSDLHQSTAIGILPSMTQQTSQQSDSDQSSSESQVRRTEAKSRKRKRNRNKDPRNTSCQSLRNRKGGEEAAVARLKLQEPNEEGLITEEGRLQEEEIRAMWAADRADAARVASRNQLAVETGASEPPPHSAHIQGHYRVDTLRVREEDDLMAGLESQLDQQRVLSGHFHHRESHSVEASHGQQPRHDRIYPDQSRPFDEASPGHSIYTRHEIGPYLDRGPSSHHKTRSFHGSARVIAAENDALYNEGGHQEYYRPTYTDNLRVRQGVPEYTEAYELIRARDSQGEYFIRRPVRLSQDQQRIAPEDGHVTYQDNRGQYSVYGNDERSRIQATYEVGTGSYGTALNHHKPHPIDDPVAYEDYDPRFPAAPSSSHFTQQVRYS